MGLAFSCFQILCVCVLLSVHVLQKFHEFRMADFFILVVKECIGVGACITRFTHGIEIRDFFWAYSHRPGLEWFFPDYQILPGIWNTGIDPVHMFPDGCRRRPVPAHCLWFFVFVHFFNSNISNTLQCCFLWMIYLQLYSIFLAFFENRYYLLNRRIFETAEGSVFLLVFVFADLFVEREDHRIDAQYDKHDDRVAKGPYQQR